MKRFLNRLFLLGCMTLFSAVGQSYAIAELIGEQELQYDFDSVEPIRPRVLSPLEEQIKELEWQLQNYGRPTPLDDETFQRVKLELNELYAQLPREHNPLDDGSDACPATLIPPSQIPYTDFGTTIGAVNNFSSYAPCGPSTAPDKIYRYVPAWGGYFSFDTFGSDFDTQLYINTGGVCPGSSHLACNDDFGGSQSAIQGIWLFGGQEYFIIVDGFQSYSGNFVLHVNNSCIIGTSNLWQVECAESVGDPQHDTYDCNGGCDNGNIFSAWQTISLCNFVKGYAFTYQDANNISNRDTDHYFISLTEPCSLRINILSTFTFDLLVTEFGPCLQTPVYYLPNMPACTPVTPILPCLPAGDYTIIIIPNFFTGMADPRPYIMQVDPIPCSGCRIDATIVAPGLDIVSGCGQGSQNTLRPSDEVTYCVIIPYASDWTFSLCTTIPWNSYMYLSSQCNGGIIAEDDNGCIANGLSVIECQNLQPGNYYLTIEGAGQFDCQQSLLSITECVGSCCYGDMWNPSCSYGPKSNCDALSGEFTLGQQCTPGLCYPRPGCEAPSAFSQQPHVPDEVWSAFASDNYLVNQVWEDYNATGFIKAVRFWGLSIDYNTGLACTEQPGDFEITFVDSSNGPQVQTYNVQAFGLPLLQNYGANFVMTEYIVDLPTICGIQSGRISIRGSDNDACVWHWATSPQGNGSVVLVNSGGPVILPSDVAVCMVEGCPAPDSVTINIHINYFTYYINFRTLADGFISLHYSDSINAVYPTNYTLMGTAWYPAGWYIHPDVNPPPQNRRYLVTLECAPEPTARAESEGILQKLNN